MNFFRNASLQLATSAVAIPIGFLTSVILARFFSVHERGVFALLVTFTGITVMLTQLGWPSATIYRLRRLNEPPARVAGLGVIATAGIGIIVFLGCALLRPWLSVRVLHNTSPLVFFLTVGMVPVQLAGLIFSSVARGIDKFWLQNLYRLGIAAGTCLAVAVVLIAGHGTLLHVVIALFGVHCGCTLWLIAVVLRATGLSFQIDLRMLRDSVVYGLKSFSQALIGQLHERIDLFMLSYLLVEASHVAYYAVAVGVGGLLQVVPESIAIALFPKLAGQDPQAAARFTTYVSRHSLIWVLGIVLASIAASPIAIPLAYGQRYSASIGPFLILAPAIAVLTVYRVLARYFLAIARQELNLYTQLVATVFNVVLNLWLIPKHGVFGAAFASLISYTIQTAAILMCFRIISGERLLEIVRLRGTDLDPYRDGARRFARRLGIDHAKRPSKEDQ